MKNKATKKQFEGESEDNKGLNQDEIDRNSTLKKVEFKEAISQRETVEPKQGVEVYKNFSKEIEKNGKCLNNNKLELERRKMLRMADLILMVKNQQKVRPSIIQSCHDLNLEMPRYSQVLKMIRKASILLQERIFTMEGLKMPMLLSK